MRHTSALGVIDFGEAYFSIGCDRFWLGISQHLEVVDFGEAYFSTMCGSFFGEAYFDIMRCIFW